MVAVDELLAQLAAAPPAAQAATFGVAVLGALFLLRALFGALFARKGLPPMVSCLPLVGGFVKFVQARFTCRLATASGGRLRQLHLNL